MYHEKKKNHKHLFLETLLFVRLSWASLQPHPVCPPAQEVDCWNMMGLFISQKLQKQIFVFD